MKEQNEILKTGWVNVYADGSSGYVWPTEQEAKDKAGEPARQIEIRVVASCEKADKGPTKVDRGANDPIDWKPWTVEMVRNHKNFQETADLHNAEMERVTK
jgi:hypothetical protein